MKHTNRLTERQQKFLRALRDEEVLLPDVLLSLKVQMPLLARWMRRRYFREALAGIQSEMRGLWFVELEQLARRATRTLRAMHEGKMKKRGLGVSVCREILEEYHRAVLRRRQSAIFRRRYKKRASPLEQERDLVHPSMRRRRKQIVARLVK